MNLKICYRSVSLILTFILTLVEFTTSSLLSKRDADGGLQTILETQAKSFSEDAFGSDTLLQQKVDQVNGISTYKIENGEDVLYKRNEDDSKKNLIILTPEEDQIPFKKVKRSRVVLRKNPDSNIFATSFLLIRDASPLDNNAVDINGAKSVIEWLNYDTHLLPGHTLEVLTAISCTSSILAPCAFNNAALETPSEKFVPSAPYTPKVGTKEERDQVASIPLVPEDGSDPNDNYDFYYDLEASKIQQGRFFGTLFGDGGILSQGILPAGFTIASGVACGIMLIVGMCGKVQGTDYEVINESGQPLDEATLQGIINGQQGRRKREVDRSADYPGWKTQYIKPTKGSSLQDSKEMFWGFGNCPHKQVNPSDLQSSPTAQAIINFYLTVLRADCLKHVELLVPELLNDEILTMDLDKKTFKLNPTHQYLSKLKLNTKEALRLASAVQLAAFSQVYSSQVQNPPPQDKPIVKFGKRQISHSAHCIVQVILNHLKLVRQAARNHILSLTRDLVLNLNTIFIKLSQDTQNLQKCDDCAQDKEVNLNDRVYIMALKQFILQGLGPVEKGSSDVDKSFDSFCEKNENTIEKIVNVYS